MEGPLDQVAAWPARTAAMGVTSAAGLVASHGPLDLPFAWASVTKPLTTLAALDGVQRDLLDLGEPTGPPGATIRHLLAHASGLAPNSDAILSKPGRQRIYSNRGIEIAAQITAARRQALRGAAGRGGLPLGLRHTRLQGSPSRGAAGPLSDLMALAGELLSPSLVDSELLAEATTTVFPGLPGVAPGFGRQSRCDWGSASRFATARHRTGPGSATRRRPSVISDAPAASCGWIPKQASPAPA
jgi:hypothetical protein